MKRFRNRRCYSSSKEFYCFLAKRILVQLEVEDYFNRGNKSIELPPIQFWESMKIESTQMFFNIFNTITIAYADIVPAFPKERHVLLKTAVSY